MTEIIQPEVTSQTNSLKQICLLALHDKLMHTIYQCEIHYLQLLHSLGLVMSTVVEVMGNNCLESQNDTAMFFQSYSGNFFASRKYNCTSEF